MSRAEKKNKPPREAEKSLTEEEKQAAYRDARTSGKYDQIWQTVGKCCFCDLNDKYVFFEKNGIAMTVQLYAYIDGHILIVPRRHVRSNKDLTPLEWETVREMMYLAKKLIRAAWGIKGVQYVQKEGENSQSTVEHLHWHVIPFDAPDLSSWNYRKLSLTPAENAAKYRKYSAKLAQLSQRFSEKYQGEA